MWILSLLHNRMSQFADKMASQLTVRILLRRYISPIKDTKLEDQKKVWTALADIFQVVLQHS